MAWYYADGWTTDTSGASVTSAGWQSNNYSYGGRIQNVPAGTCTKIALRLYRAAAGTSNVTAALYDASGNLITTGTAQTSPGDGETAWVEWTISESLSAGSYHVLYSSSDADTCIYYSTTATGKYVNHVYTNAWPDPATIGDEANSSYGAKMDVTAGGPASVSPAETVVTIGADAGTISQVTFQVVPVEASITIGADAGAVVQGVFQIAPAESAIVISADSGAVTQSGIQVAPVESAIIIGADAGGVAQVTFQVAPSEASISLAASVGSIAQSTFEVVGIGATLVLVADAGEVNQSGVVVTPAEVTMLVGADAGGVSQVSFQVSPVEASVLVNADTVTLFTGTVVSPADAAITVGADSGGVAQVTFQVTPAETYIISVSDQVFLTGSGDGDLLVLGAGNWVIARIGQANRNIVFVDNEPLMIDEFALRV